MAPLSFRRRPLLPARRLSSEPAKSMRHSFAVWWEYVGQSRIRFTRTSNTVWLRLERWFSWVDATVRFLLAGRKWLSKSAKLVISFWVKSGTRMLWLRSSRIGRSRREGWRRSKTWGMEEKWMVDVEFHMRPSSTACLSFPQISWCIPARTFFPRWVTWALIFKLFKKKKPFSNLKFLKRRGPESILHWFLVFLLRHSFQSSVKWAFFLPILLQV